MESRPGKPAKSDSSQTDKLLLRRIRLGDTSAFESVFREHYGNLCDFVDGYVRSRTEAEEIVDDLFYALWLRRAQWRPTTTVRASLFAGAHNRALSYRRRSALERGIDADTLGEVLHTHRLDPGHGADVSDEARRLHSAIAALPERARLAVRLRWLERMQYQEIAEAMDIPVKGVQKLVNSALHALRSALEPHAEHPE
jgi:RNA polymerase sigma-19 factor, ECF subfamily